MTDSKHPLYGYSENEKIDYLSLVATIAATDGDVSNPEIAKLREICKSVEISPAGIGTILSVAENPDELNLDELAKRLSNSELKFTLLTDMIFLAKADENYSTDEKNLIKDIAKKLGVKEEQILAMEKYADAIDKAQKSGNSSEDLKKLGGEVSAGLASAGVPIAAVAVSGSVYGLSAAGITSGLAALGLGLGMTTGIGVVAAIGAGSYFGVRYLYKKIVGA